MTEDLSRREALRSLALGAASASLAGGPLAAETGPAPLAPAEQPPGVCRLTPQAVEGPYYFDPDLVRSDITEGRPGLPLSLSLRIIESGPCTAIAGARVDVWHADAGGIYSGYADQGDSRSISTEGERYLRGTQMTDGEGVVTFRSIYPGWYPGRTPHIHVKVFLDKRSVLTGQVYFPDELSQRIYREREPYSLRPVPDTTNARDGIFRAAEREGGGTVLATEDAGPLITASLTIAVDRSGGAARRAEGWGGWMRRLLGD